MIEKNEILLFFKKTDYLKNLTWLRKMNAIFEFCISKLSRFSWETLDLREFFSKRRPVLFTEEIIYSYNQYMTVYELSSTSYKYARAVFQSLA